MSDKEARKFSDSLEKSLSKEKNKLVDPSKQNLKEMISGAKEKIAEKAKENITKGKSQDKAADKPDKPGQEDR